MSSYRNSQLATVFKSDKVILSRSQGAALKSKLDRLTQDYEKTLRKEFLYTYFESFRVTIFGSAKIKNTKSEEFKFIEKLSRHLAKAIDAVDIVTGGGGGIMLAANKGLVEARKNDQKIQGKNLGIMVDLPTGDKGNGCLDEMETYENFSVRLEEFIRKSNGIYLAPGGYGTKLEAAMFIQLKQKKKFEHIFPIVAHPFWKPIINYGNDIFFDRRVEHGQAPLIDEKDKRLVIYTDDISEIVKIFKRAHHEWEQLKRKVEYVD